MKGQAMVLKHRQPGNRRQTLQERWRQGQHMGQQTQKQMVQERWRQGQPPPCRQTRKQMGQERRQLESQTLTVQERWRI